MVGTLGLGAAVISWKHNGGGWGHWSITSGWDRMGGSVPSGCASCHRCFPKSSAHRYSCTSVEPYVNTVTTRPPSANPKNETTGFTACHLQRARPHVLIRKPCHEQHGEPQMAPAAHDLLLPPPGQASG